jgi:hypothetical protein
MKFLVSFAWGGNWAGISMKLNVKCSHTIFHMEIFAEITRENFLSHTVIELHGGEFA